MEPHPGRLVLSGVPRIHFYEGGPGCPEDICLPSVIRALLEYLGDDQFGCKTCRSMKAGCPINCTYSFMMGVTGAGSYLSWKKGWEDDNEAIIYMSANAAAPESRAFKAAGYACQFYEQKPGEDIEALFSNLIIASLQKGIPVIAYGVVGPPEPALITGYDEDGTVLIGWSFFQNFPEFSAGIESEASGEFRKRNWLKDTYSLLIIGEKQPKPTLPEIFKDALEWALIVTNTPIVHPEAGAPEKYRERANGLAAYDAWANHLLRDEDFSSGNDAVLMQRHNVHNGAVGSVAEKRFYGSQFLIQATEHLHYSMTEDLLHAAACYSAEHNLMWKLWNLAGGNGNPEAYKKFANPAIRRQMVPIIHEAREKDAAAAFHIAQALKITPKT